MNCDCVEKGRDDFPCNNEEQHKFRLTPWSVSGLTHPEWIKKTHGFKHIPFDSFMDMPEEDRRHHYESWCDVVDKGKRKLDLVQDIFFEWKKPKGNSYWEDRKLMLDEYLRRNDE